MFLGAALLLIAPTWADNVFYVGFKDLVNGDYDYQDLVLQLSAPGLNVVIPNNDGAWFSFSPSELGTNDMPFWNNLSDDGPNKNVGNCIYGGACPAPAGSSGLAPNDKYLAAGSGPGAGIDSVADVYFSVPVGVTVDASVLLHIAADPDVIGWYPVGDPSDITWINSASTELDTLDFTPGGEFGLVAENIKNVQFFYSNTSDGGTTDTGEHVSHFAVFGDPSGDPIPEPGTVMLMGTALLGISVMLRRRKKENAD